jgi:hypothetical protein
MKLGIYLEEHKPGLHPKRPAEIGWLGALSELCSLSALHTRRGVGDGLPRNSFAPVGFRITALVQAVEGGRGFF